MNQFIFAEKPAPAIKEDFGFLYECKEERNKICLLGEFEEGLLVFLLNKNNSSVCTAKTAEQGKKDIDDLSYTKLINLTNCKKPSEYSIGYIGRPPKMYDIDTYKSLPLRHVSDTKLREQLNKKVRKTNILQTLLDQNGGIVGLYKPEKDLNSLPAILQYPVPGSTVYMLTYDLTWKSNEGSPIGPRVVIINDSVQGLTGQCSYKEVRGFTIMGEYYIESGSHCCECGITGQELFKIDGNEIKRVYEDFSFSD